MKTLIMSLLALGSSLFAYPQGVWTARDTLPDSAMFQGIPGFSIGNYGYAGLGGTYYAGHPSRELFQFDPSTNSWTSKAPFPGKARVAPACFVIGNDAYLVCGSVTSGGNCVNECWQYNAITDKWTQKANFPGPARTYAVGFAIDSLGYVGTGANELSDFRKDFYAYHPSTNTWTKIADFGGTPRDVDAGFAVNGLGYVCCGKDSINLDKDLWQYNPVTNLWTRKADYPYPIQIASGFAICSNIYVHGDSTFGFSKYNGFRKYNTVTDTWTQETNLPGKNRIEGVDFSIADTGYFGFGSDSSGVVDNIFAEFYGGDSCELNTGDTYLKDISEIRVYPNPADNLLNINFNRQMQGPATLSIMNILGTEFLCCKKNISNGIVQMDVSSLPAGMYFIYIKTKEKSITNKFIKN